MDKKLRSSAHTPAPWTYSGAEMDSARFWIWSAGAKRKYVASVGLRDEANGKEARANAHLIAAAPELLRLARTFSESCEERLTLLNDEMITAPNDTDLDDIQDQIDHWHALFDTCQLVIADAEGRWTEAET